MPDRFKRSVAEMAELKQDGLVDNIIFVTWKGRLDEDIERFLEDYDVEIIEKKESPVGGEGNIWHQMRALDYGLRDIPTKSRVLKTRTDVYIEKKFLKRLFSGKVDYIGEPAGSGVFEERIWSPYFELGVPFYLCDYCFFGLKKDIEKLVNFDSRYDFLYDIEQSNPEVRRFIHPYLQKYPFLEEYLMYYKGHNFKNRKEPRGDLLISRLNSPIYGAFMSFYYKILLSDFYLNYDPVTFADGGWIRSESTPVTLARDGTEFISNFQLGPGEGRHLLYSDQNSWLESQFTDEPNDDVPQNIIKGIEKPFSEWKTTNITQKDIQTDIERDAEFFDLNNYPDNRISKLFADLILDPLGLTEFSRYIYNSLLN